MDRLARPKTVWLLLSILLLSGTVALAQAGAPLEKMRQTLDSLVAIFADETLKSPEQAQARRAKIRQVLSQRFAYEAMAQQAMGRHWHNLTAAQQQEFIPLFSDLLEGEHIQRVEKYGGTAKSLVFKKETINPDRSASVNIEIVDPHSPTTNEEVEYRLQERNNDWHVHDILIEGASMVINYRAQFDKIITQESYAELVRRLKMSSIGR
jgi:phospholipid transport system substrate-binding protein